MKGSSYIEIQNGQNIRIADIPVLDYPEFFNTVEQLMQDTNNHVMIYYAVDCNDYLKYYCCIGNDADHLIKVLAHSHDKSCKILDSITVEVPAFHIFEREIHENFGIQFHGHPWLKPIRWSFDRFNQSSVMDNYPFFTIEGEELHEVGVGPVHAGIIEPGHFRFICNGEKVLHLEIHLGYQHRGVERLFLERKSGLQRAVLSESIAGDTSVAGALVHAQLMESLAGISVSDSLQLERCIALELERIAIHIGDTAALCTDVAYQLGQVVNEALRTTIINTTQFWCGNRFGKGLIRPGGTHYPLSRAVSEQIKSVLADTGRRYCEIADRIYSLPSVLARFDGIGEVTEKQVSDIGAVGMAARSAGLKRDIRQSHPFQYFRQYHFDPVVQSTGDVLARGMLRNLEVRESVRIIGELLKICHESEVKHPVPVPDYKLEPGMFAISVAEAWRGELCHCAITDEKGNLKHYKVKDPSMHNWFALALAVRNQEISDFPVCNKSFNLSYCGFDL
ncbi:MAG TPA: NADH-quinone oxidoreductase subunit C [Bacteroidales bacterium]|nr:NADH-quinone oxidoreductase subunit C [Bacteroidales bacterium]